VALTGHNEAYYTDFLGRPQEFVSAARHGFLYPGQRHRWHKKRRGTPAWRLRPSAFVAFLENHDQVANSARGLRCHQVASPGRHRALTALLLLGPATPMLFQGQEFSASNPFFFFADHRPELARVVRQGRADYLCCFPSIARPEVKATLPDPADPAIFARCKLDLTERDRNSRAYALHRDLLRLRREDPVFQAPRAAGLDGAVLGPEAFVLRFFGQAAGDRLLVVNLGSDLHLEVTPEPLLAPPPGITWEIQWSSEDPRYGGQGTPPLDTEDGWRLPGQAAVVLCAQPAPGA
jgi:maltooligosyltrehalose trehalohydrolase